jgi:Heavy-metal-associated domain
LSTNLQLRMVVYSALIVLLCVALSYIYQNRADANTSITSHSDSIRIVRIRLQGWEDNKLPYTRQSLQEIPGVVEVKFEPASHRAVIRLDIERTNLQAIEKSLHRAGFTPSYQ